MAQGQGRRVPVSAEITAFRRGHVTPLISPRCVTEEAGRLGIFLA